MLPTGELFHSRVALAYGCLLDLYGCLSSSEWSAMDKEGTEKRGHLQMWLQSNLSHIPSLIRKLFLGAIAPSWR